MFADEKWCTDEVRQKFSTVLGNAVDTGLWVFKHTEYQAIWS